MKELKHLKEIERGIKDVSATEFDKHATSKERLLA